MKNQNSKFKLFWNKQPIVISYRNPSGKLALLFSREISKLKINDNKSTQAIYGVIISKYLSDDASISNESNFLQAMQKAFTAGDISAEDMMSIVNNNSKTTPEDLAHDYEIYINLFKEIVDFTELNPKNKELLSSDWDSEFWMEQNLQEVKDQVIFFRQQYL